MKPIKGLRWWIIGLVLSGLIMNYLARNALAVAAPEVNKILNISTQQYGYIVAAFQAAYMVMQPVAGYVLDVLGTKLGFALFAAAWSAVCILHSTAGGWLSLAAFRAGGIFDRIASLVSLIGASAPDFWVAIVAIVVFALGLGWLPTSGTGTVWHWILPVGVLFIRPFGLIVQVVRA